MSLSNLHNNILFFIQRNWHHARYQLNQLANPPHIYTNVCLNKTFKGVVLSIRKTVSFISKNFV